MTKDILITFDYELFLGFRSGSVQNCLLEPTSKILRVLQDNNCKAIFFVDLTYLNQLKIVSSDYTQALIDYNLLIEQLKTIAKLGHFIHYHIHPHWLDAIYLPKENEWDLSNKDCFALSNLEEGEVSQIFEDSYNILQNDIGLNISKHNPVGFRAGGLYIQPFNTLQEVFKKYFIAYDFSVLQGAKSSDSQGRFSFDYSVCPKLPVYRFSNDVNKIDENGPFTEVLLKQVELKNGYKIANGLFYRLMKKHSQHIIIGDGKSSGNVINKPVNGRKKYFKALETISIEMINPVRASLYMKELKMNNFIHFISHPKLFSPYCIKQFDLFLKKAKRNFIIETDFKKIIEHQSRSNGE